MSDLYKTSKLNADTRGDGAKNNNNASLNEKIGETMHYPPATKEWVNSTYSYNKNYTKTLPVADNVVNKLIKGYLNMNPLLNNKKSRHVEIRFKRLSLNRIIASKAEVKHTNNKVVITVYLYNRNKKFFLYKLKSLYLGDSLATSALNSKKSYLHKIKSVYKANTLASMRLNSKRKTSFLHKLKNLYMVNLLATSPLNNKSFLYKVKNIYKGNTLSLNNKKKTLSEENPNLELKYLKRKLRFISVRAVKLINKARKHQSLLFKTLSWDNSNLINYKIKYYKNFIKDAYEIELLYMYYIKMLSLNNNKFKNWFLLGLKRVISKLYNKKVEFNFVNLKYLHLNSDIFTNSIATRIKNRDNALLRVLKKALRLAKVPSKNPNLKYNTNFNASLYSNKHISLSKKMLSLTSTKNSRNDALHMLLSSLFGGKVMKENRSGLTLKAKSFNDKQLNVLHDIKHKTVLGVRLEAAGRLTKRLTASRSLFKLRYKGGLKNLDIYKKTIPSVMLKGNTKPNVQYTLINSKTRNGSFGLKGWINGF